MTRRKVPKAAAAAKPTDSIQAPTLSAEALAVASERLRALLERIGRAEQQIAALSALIGSQIEWTSHADASIENIRRDVHVLGSLALIANRKIADA